MTTWFTSDPHYGHRLVTRMRGFGDDVAAHDDAIAGAWRERVQDVDIVWVLGDIAVSNPTRALDVIGALPGRKRLIVGNHDRVHPMNRDAHKWSARFAEVFEFVAPFARVRVFGIEALLSHFPYARDRGEVRCTQWRLRDEGAPLIHGHLHVEERLVGREIHVGVDAWSFAPVKDVEVGELLDAMPVQASQGVIR